MEIKGNLHNRLIYVYEFSDNHAYVGLTFDIKERNRIHTEKGSVYKHILKTGLKPILKYGQYVDVIDAIRLEGETVEMYKKNGWNILNKTKTGAIGGNIKKWTIDKLKEEALKYKTKTEFKEKSGGAYSTAQKTKLLNEICNHMI